MSEPPLSFRARFLPGLFAALGWGGLLLFAVLGAAAWLGLGETHGLAISVVLFFFVGMPGLALGLVFLMMSRWEWGERDEEDEEAAAAVRELPRFLLHGGVIRDEGEIGQPADGLGDQQVSDGEGQQRGQEIAVAVPGEAHVAEPPSGDDVRRQVKALDE